MITSQSTPSDKPVITRDQFNQLLNLYSTDDVSARFRNRDLSNVLPNVAALHDALHRIPPARRAAFLNAIGATYLGTLFEPDNAFFFLLHKMGAQLLRDLPTGMSFIQHIKTQNELLDFIQRFPGREADLPLLATRLPAQRLDALIPTQMHLLQLLQASDRPDILPKLSRLVTTQHAANLILGESGLAGFLNQYAGHADALIHLFNLMPQLNTQRIGHFKTVLERVQNPSYRQTIIRLLANCPEQLADFDDKALLAILNETSDNDLNAFLAQSHQALAQRPYVLRILAETRLKSIQTADVFIKYYLNVVPEALWTQQWEVVVNQLLNHPDQRTDLFLTLGEMTTKDILDHYQTMTGSLQNTVASQQYAQKWVDGLLFLQEVWSGLDQTQETLCANLCVLPFILTISIIGLVPAMIGGLVYLACVRPLQSEIDQKLTAFPGKTLNQVLGGYDSLRDYHLTLALGKAGFFSQKPESNATCHTPLLPGIVPFIPS